MALGQAFAKELFNLLRSPKGTNFRPDMQEVRKSVLDLATEELSHQAICRRLDFEGHPTPAKSKWSHLSWTEAHEHHAFRRAVKKWLSIAISKTINIECLIAPILELSPFRERGYRRAFRGYGSPSHERGGVGEGSAAPRSGRRALVEAVV